MLDLVVLEEKGENKPYRCDFPNCCKCFKRKDHLRRHKKNHEPSKWLPCPWQGCNLRFVRSDVKEKHYKRHLQKEIKMIPGDTIYANVPNLDDNLANISETDSVVERCNTSLGIVNQYGLNTPRKEKQPPLEKNNEKLKTFNIIDFLLNANFKLDFNLSEMGLQSQFTGFAANRIMLKEPVSNLSKINDAVFNKLINIIPSLESNSDFRIPQLERMLEIYWLVYHPQYPVLHRPTFSIEESHSLLLLAMIMIGAGLCNCSFSNETFVFHNPQKLAEEIAVPLRGLILSNCECRYPVSIYIIQSLLLLESFEISSTTRILHERSILYHGTKVQLLRRNSASVNRHRSFPSGELKRWVELESIRRAYFMAFYLDILHATVYEYNNILNYYQIKLALPCEEALWECDNYENLSNGLIDLNSPMFIESLGKLLNGGEIKINGFGNRILFAGLISVLFQIQENIVYFSSITSLTTIDSWFKRILLAIDKWKFKNSCTGIHTSPMLYFPIEIQEKLPPSLRFDDTRCKFPLYHMSHIYASIRHQDLLIFAGVPTASKIMNFDISSNFNQARNRIEFWSKSPGGRLCALHAYLFLFEILLSPFNEDIIYSYHPNADPYFHQKHVVLYTLLVLFAYNFSLYGPESIQASSIYDYIPEKEDGYAYLKRVRASLSKGPGGNFQILFTNYNYDFSEILTKHAEFLPLIEEKNNLVGLLKIFFKSFRDSNWQLGREYARLIANCIQRCLGSESIVCEDMYE